MDMNQSSNLPPDPIINKLRNDNKDPQQKVTGNRCKVNFNIDARYNVASVTTTAMMLTIKSAKLVHKYTILANPKKAKDNAQAYSLTNNKKQISKM
jgi:hypothetical protein